MKELDLYKGFEEYDEYDFIAIDENNNVFIFSLNHGKDLLMKYLEKQIYLEKDGLDLLNYIKKVFQMILIQETIHIQQKTTWTSTMIY